MIPIEKIVLTLLQIANSDSVILVSVAPYYQYIDGKRTEQIAGYRYNVVAHENAFERFAVKVPNLPPVISNDEIASNGEPVLVTFGDFQGKFYRDFKSGQYKLTATAVSAKIVEPDEEE